MQKASKIILQFFIWLLSLLPFSVVYKLSSFTAWLLRHAFQYRLKVVRQNLRNSFPDKGDQELNKIEKQYYSYLADLTLESLKGMTASKAEMTKRFVYRGAEVFDKYYQEEKSVIMVAGHYGNWEWATLTFPLVVKHKVIGIFKPLNNRLIDDHLNTLRTKWGNNLVSMAQAGRAVVENRKQPTIFVLIADQTPSDTQNADWLSFLNQDTPFLHGVDKLAQQTGYPVIFCKVTRANRGYYEMAFEELSANPKELQEGDITQLFAKKLEQQIRENPVFWLWSHRRWKRKRP